MSCGFNLPSDYVILRTIYDMYYDEFTRFEAGAGWRLSKVFVPVDFEKVARRLEIDGDIVFGRIYYYLDNKYSYEYMYQGKMRKVSLFTMEMEGDNRKQINFPMLASILAGLHETNTKQNLTIGIAAVSLLVSIASAVFSYMS